MAYNPQSSWNDYQAALSARQAALDPLNAQVGSTGTLNEFGNSDQASAYTSNLADYNKNYGGYGLTGQNAPDSTSWNKTSGTMSPDISVWGPKNGFNVLPTNVDDLNKINGAGGPTALWGPGHVVNDPKFGQVYVSDDPAQAVMSGDALAKYNAVVKSYDATHGEPGGFFNDAVGAFTKGAGALFIPAITAGIGGALSGGSLVADAAGGAGAAGDAALGASGLGGVAEGGTVGGIAGGTEAAQAALAAGAGGANLLPDATGPAGVSEGSAGMGAAGSGGTGATGAGAVGSSLPTLNISPNQVLSTVQKLMGASGAPAPAGNAAPGTVAPGTAPNYPVLNMGGGSNNAGPSGALFQQNTAPLGQLYTDQPKTFANNYVSSLDTPPPAQAPTPYMGSPGAAPQPQFDMNKYGMWTGIGNIFPHGLLKSGGFGILS